MCTIDTTDIEDRLDRLEMLLDRLGQVVGHHSIEFGHLRGVRPVERDFTAGPLFEFKTLHPAFTDDETLTWVLDIRGDEDEYDADGPYVAGCGCRWGQSVNTTEEGHRIAFEHALKAHEEFAERYPELVGPTLP